MEIDFSAMSLGDEVGLPDATWDDTRHFFNEAMEYTRAVTSEPRPQFQFDAKRPARMREVPGWSGWIVRRIR